MAYERIRNVSFCSITIIPFPGKKKSIIFKALAYTIRERPRVVGVKLRTHLLQRTSFVAYLPQKIDGQYCSYTRPKHIDIVTFERRQHERCSLDRPSSPFWSGNELARPCFGPIITLRTKIFIIYRDNTKCLYFI